MDDARLRAANVATRVPALVLDDGTALTESLLIVHWLERTYPESPSLLGQDASSMAGVLARVGIALGAIDASVHTIITRKVTAPVLFDETPVGLRRRRTMVEGAEHLESNAEQMIQIPIPTLDTICAVVFFDYQQFRYPDQPWLPSTPRLQHLAESMRARSSFESTLPYDP